MLTNFQTEPNYCCSENINRNSTPVQLSVAQNLNRHSVYKSMDNNPHFPKEFSTVNDSFEKLRSNKMSDYGGSRDMSNRLSILNSDNSLDYPVNKLNDKEFSSYYKKNKAGKLVVLFLFLLYVVHLFDKSYIKYVATFKSKVAVLVEFYFCNIFFFLFIHLDYFSNIHHVVK